MAVGARYRLPVQIHGNLPTQTRYSNRHDGPARSGRLRIVLFRPVEVPASACRTAPSNGAGPFTVFAPTNAAFNKLSPGTVDTLVKPENKAQLTRILTYHVVPGNFSSAQLIADARKHGGKATLKTVQGEPLTVTLHDGKLWVVDAKGGKAGISIADVGQSNGVIHVIDTVLMPK
ncbi:hypothetical protein FACS189498_4400 [Spirochaetia bacterium]|nr:hypothetical protein FACS189498_4400 [Spirochaetia bacterium]